jgi:hypothetical protein
MYGVLERFCVMKNVQIAVHVAPYNATARVTMSNSIRHLLTMHVFTIDQNLRGLDSPAIFSASRPIPSISILGQRDQRISHISKSPLRAFQKDVNCYVGYAGIARFSLFWRHCIVASTVDADIPVADEPSANCHVIGRGESDFF